MNNLSNEIVHLSKVLEKQIPKGYHELVIEYVRQNIVNGVGNFLLALFLLGIVIAFIKVVIKNYLSGEEGFFFDEDHDETLALLICMIAAIGLSICAIAFFKNSFTDLQHVVAPNYYLKSFIK